MSAMKKNTLRHLSRILATVLLTGLLMSLWGTAVSDGDGTLTVRIGADNPDLQKRDIRISIYQIGTEDNTAPGYWRISSYFDGIDILGAKTSGQLEDAANKVADILHARNSGRITGTPDANGVATFTGLNHGVYFGEVSEGPDGLRARNFIVTIPNLGVSPITNDVIVNMKYSYDTPEPPPEVTTPGDEKKVEETPTPTPTPGPNPYKLTIYYIYEDGTTAWETYHEELWPDEKYDVWSPVIPGYRATILRVQGVMPHHDVEYVVIYIPRGTNLIDMDDYETALGLGDIQVHVGVCFE